jgi:hypothetical protein
MKAKNIGQKANLQTEENRIEEAGLLLNQLHTKAERYQILVEVKKRGMN